MKKVLILSYFFPPSNFAGSYRMKAWAENLHKFGYYPIVVTRHWTDNETDYTAISDNDKIEKEEYVTHIVYRLPYKGSTRDKLIKKYGEKSKIVGKVFSFFQLLTQNYFIRSCPFSNLYFFSKELLNNDKSIRILLTSGRPFIHFKFAWHLKKEFPTLKWIADYRDPWNSWSEIDNSMKLSLFRFIELPMEREWISNSSFFTTCSEGFRANINSIHNKQGYVITNGFADFHKYNDGVNNNKELLSIGYIGSLYNNQKIEVFLNGFTKFLKKHHNAKIHLVFFGLSNQSKQVKRISQHIIRFEQHVFIQPWFKKEKMIEYAKRIQFFLLCGIPSQKGRHTAKLFDYFALQKSIVLCPSDKDILEETIQETNSGVVLDSEIEVFNWIKKTYTGWQKNKIIPYSGDINLISEYKYENQVRKLAKHLDEL